MMLLVWFLRFQLIPTSSYLGNSFNAAKKWRYFKIHVPSPNEVLAENHCKTKANRQLGLRYILTLHCTPKIKRMPLKRDYFSRECIWTNHWFSLGYDMWVFRGFFGFSHGFLLVQLSSDALFSMSTKQSKTRQCTVPPQQMVTWESRILIVNLNLRFRQKPPPNS